MSAIFGLLALNEEPIDASTLQRFGASLAHRGRGEPTLWVSAAVGLGCCHFPTTPEAVGGTVPYVHAASGVVVTGDVRLDNRDELIARLGSPEANPKNPPDEWLLAEAYLRWGEACPEHLLGDFAFAAWDPRHRRLFAARDHFGIKPFYYVVDGHRFAFATEPRALLDVPGVSREIDYTSLAVTLAEIFDNSDRTVYRDIRSLRNAEAMTVTKDGPRIRRYYEPDPERRVSLSSDEAYAEALREILFRAVRRRLRSAGPVGCMLSGGLDSSAATCVAAQISAAQSLPKPEAFSLVYPDRPECDESRYIEAVVRRFDLPWHPVPVNDRRTLADITRLVDRLQTPHVPLGAFANGSVCQQAAACGMTVLLDGHGGDETVSLGFEHLRELFDDRRILALSYEYLRLAPTDPEMNGWRGLLRVLTNMGLAGRVKRRFVRIATRCRGRSPDPVPGVSWPFIDESLVREAGLEAKNAAMKAAQVEAREKKRWHHYVITHTAQQRGFENLHRLGGGGTLELRYPLWDKDLVEFCLALPGRQKLRHGFTRAVLRRAVRGIVPEEVTRRRDKTDFLPQATECLKKLGENNCKSLIGVHNPHGISILNLEWINATLVRFHEDQHVSSLEQQALWRSLALAAWLRMVKGA